MSPNLRALVLILASLGAPAGAHAQAIVDGGSTGADDPLGVDPDDHLERVAPTRASEEVRPRFRVRRGAVLAAIAGVREASHEVDVELGYGLARIEERMRFESSARHPAELRYRVAVPPGASLAALEVCNRHGCRAGAIDPSEGLGPYDRAAAAYGQSSGVPPIGHVALVEDDRGPALWLRAAPVEPAPPRQHGHEVDAGLVVRLTYVVPAPIRGSHVRLTLPARGEDHRVAPARVRVRSEQLSSAAVGGIDAVERAVERPAWEETEITARLTSAAPALRLESWQVPCGSRTCARLRAVAGPRAIAARDIVVLLDASPSTAGPARGRIGPAVGALLAALPEESRVRIASFAARAEAVVERDTAPGDVSLVAVQRALESRLGSATRFEAAWELIAPWVDAMRSPLILLIGDGGLTESGESRRALAAARRSADLAVLNVADRPTTVGLARLLDERLLDEDNAHQVEAGPEAARAAAGHGMSPLTERLGAVLAPVVEAHVRARVGGRTIDLGGLRAGEEVVWEGPVRRGRAVLLGRRRRARAADPPELLAVPLRDRLERIATERTVPTRLAALRVVEPVVDEDSEETAEGSASDEIVPPVGSNTHLALVHRRRPGHSPFPSPTQTADSTPPIDAPAALQRADGPTSLPERSLLTLLRQRIVPAARGCFRNDRRGRPSYQRRAVFEFSLADREIITATISGTIPASLRACLTEAMDTLEIPRFDGTIRVRYPIYTAPRLPPPTLSLHPDTADAVDAVTPP